MESPFLAYEHRLFVCYGLTRDCFCPPTGVLINYDEYLHLHLQGLGYQRLMFYSHLGLYFLDADSRNAIMEIKTQATKPAMPNLLRKLSPAGLSLRQKPQAGLQDAAAPQRWHYPNLPATELTPRIRQLMLSPDVPTAIIFNTDHLESFFRSSETATYFRGMLETDFRSLPASNRNIMIFVFGMEQEILFQHINGKPWDLLFQRAQDGARHGIARPVRIGPPEKDEVSRIIQHYRLLRGLSIDWQGYEKMVRVLTASLRCSSDKSGGAAVGLRQLERWLENLTRNNAMLTQVRIKELTQMDISEKSAQERLNDLEGLSAIKKLIKQNIALFQDARKAASAIAATPPTNTNTVNRLAPERKTGLAIDYGTLHLALVGNPGTGKTTVARLIGEIYRDAGILELGHTIVCKRRDLVGQYVGDTAIKTGARIDAAMGGVLFIDEAYSLIQGGENDFGTEAITEILEAMSARMGQFMVILAGYPEKIQELIDSNPGFARRIQTIHLEDSTPGLLEHIFRISCRDAIPPLDLDPELDAALPLFFEELCRRKTENFGNAGTVKDEIFQEVRRNSEHGVMGRRVAKKSHFPDAYQPCFQERVAAHIDQIETLIGLKDVKKRIQDLIDLKDIDHRRAIQDGRSQSIPVPGHYLFVGNPGTGKTTVARMMAEQFKQIGLLKRGHLVSVTASELSGQYLGTTENKTREILEKSLGGVCFVDEAHQLATPHGYGAQALGVIVPFLTDHETEFSMIFAGYPDSIHHLLQMDIGLKRRFESPILFGDYLPAELLQIFHLMAKQENLKIDPDADEVLAKLFDDIDRRKTREFGNAGTVKKLLGRVRMHQAGRLKQTLTDTGLSILTVDDIPHIDTILDMI